jgi:hypothetical protein
MTLPTGSGSERLRRITANDNTGWNEVHSGVSLHIYTFISVIATNMTTSAQLMSFRMNDGSEDIALTEGILVPAWGTFVFSDKFVLEEDDDLDIYSAANSDWVISYIDQDWT